MDVLENLSHEATSLIVGFAVKFLAWRYLNSMVTWFGKARMGMYIACVIVKDHEENLKKGHV